MGLVRPYIADGRTLVRFMADRSMVRGLIGPWGSGKSVCCVQEILRKAITQRPSTIDGVRRSRWAIIRETVVEMRMTTMKTWFDWVPQTMGSWRDQGPPRHLVKFNLSDGSVAELEVIFIALESPKDRAQLDSLELTGIWVNEARHVIEDNIRNLVGRTGRYPSKSEGGSEHGRMVIMDTNPPDVDHWWYETFEERRPEKYAVFHQPSGLSPEAENLKWLEDGYYQDLCINQGDEWIKVYVHGQYGYSADGQPVYPEYDDAFHCSPVPLKPVAGLPLSIGLDAGLTPAAIFQQIMPNGQKRWLAELTTTRMGPKPFGREINRILHERFPGIEVACGWADPSAGTGADKEAGELTWIETVSNVTRIRIKPAPTNALSERIAAVATPLSPQGAIDRLTPGLIICPTMKVVRKGFISGYHYRRIQTGGGARYTDVPDKNNIYSHPHDGGQYVALGESDWSELTGRDKRRRRSRRGARYASSDLQVSV